MLVPLASSVCWVWVPVVHIQLWSTAMLTFSADRIKMEPGWTFCLITFSRVAAEWLGTSTTNIMLVSFHSSLCCWPELFFVYFYHLHLFLSPYFADSHFWYHKCTNLLHIHIPVTNSFLIHFCTTAHTTITNGIRELLANYPHVNNLFLQDWTLHFQNTCEKMYNFMCVRFKIFSLQVMHHGH